MRRRIKKCSLIVHEVYFWQPQCVCFSSILCTPAKFCVCLEVSVVNGFKPCQELMKAFLLEAESLCACVQAIVYYTRIHLRLTNAFIYYYTVSSSCGQYTYCMIINLRESSSDFEPSAVSNGHCQGQFVNFLAFDWTTGIRLIFFNVHILEWLSTHQRQSHSTFFFYSVLAKSQLSLGISVLHVR